MSQIKATLSEIKFDLSSNRFSLKLFISNYLYSPRFRVLLNHRIGKHFYKRDFFLFSHLAKYYKKCLVVNRNCDISYNTSIGKNLKMPHPIGIVIGDGVIIHDNVMIFQQVTLGSHGKKGQKKNYPEIMDGVKIYAGAKIIGGITIGANAVIGTNAVVNINIPANAIAVGIPCKIISIK